MVKRLKKNHLTLAISLIVGGALATACSPSKWWGEAKPGPQVIMQAAGAACPDAMQILTATPDRSRETFECWANQATDLWSSIEGSETGKLSEFELKRLADRGVLALSGDAQRDNQKIQAIIKLLGLNSSSVNRDGTPKRDERDGSLTRLGVSGWIVWVRNHRPQMRRLYLRMIVGDGNPITYDNFEDALTLISDALKKTQWNFNAESLGEVIAPFFPITNPNVVNAPIPLARVAVNLIAAYCPTLQDRRRIKSQELAACLPAISTHLRPGAPWIEFLLNGMVAKTATPAEISLSMDRLMPAITSWFQQPQLGTVDPTLWIDLGRKMNIQISESALDSLAWINKFNRNSTQFAIHPTLNILLYSIARDYFKGMLDGMPYFTDCTNGPVRHWMECRPRDPAALAPKSETLRTALRIHNLNYAKNSLPFDGANFSRVELFYALARPVIDVYDTNGDRFLQVDQNLETNNNEIIDAISAAFQLLKNVNLIRNLAHRFVNEPLEYETTEDDLKAKEVRIRGLTRLATLMGDTFTPLTEQEIQDKGDNLRRMGIRVGAKGAVEINQVQLASVIHKIDAISTIRFSFDDESLMGVEAARTFTPHYVNGQLVVSRSESLKHLRELLQQNFPVLHEGCDKWGYERTCDIVMDMILAAPLEDPVSHRTTDYIHVAELDMITLTALFAESLVSRCDFNGDGRFERGGFFRNSHKDEVDCLSITLTSAAQRLIEANVIKKADDGSDMRKVAKFAIQVQSIFGPLRAISQTALMRGTMSGLVLNWILYPLRKYATLGSVMGLAAELIAPEKTKPYDEEYGRPAPRGGN